MNRMLKTLPLFLALAAPATIVTAAQNAVAAEAKVYKVADVFKDKAKLDNQKVTIKGKVAKVSSGIMGLNWMHIQDGSGDAASKTNDITVTTNDELPSAGTTVTVTGTLHKDKDFGSGYFYPAIIQEASIKKK